MLDEDHVEGGTFAYLFYCGGGSLNAHLMKLRKKQLAMNEANTVIVTAQIASALQHCHSIGVAHRDVKPANVLYDGQRWRLCDFGFAVQAGAHKLRGQLGSLVYCAPEILNGKSAYVGWAVDMYALGAMLYEMRTGRTCFVAADEPTLRLRISNGFKGGSEGFPWLPAMSEDCRNLISALLVKAPPEGRLRAHQVLEHRWVLANCTPAGEGAVSATYTDDAGGGLDGIAADDDSSGTAAPHPVWWCDVAADGCLRPEQPTHEDQYDANDRCWAHPNGTYMVCEACHAAGCAEHMDVLRLLEASEITVG